ncbi:RNA polymerase II assembly factor like protein [Tanacetum coccineum]
MFPRLYALEACKNLSVASKLSQSSLDFSFRRALRGGVEQSQLAAMLSKLDGVSLVNLRDKWRWSLVGSGEFSVASVRKWIDDKTLPMCYFPMPRKRHNTQTKRIQTHGSEVLKASQVIVDAVICLCKAYCNNTKSDDNCRAEKDVQSSVKESDDVDHVISVAKCVDENLVELGILAANIGGNLVTLLNLSWKGVVTLLQLGKGFLSLKLNISDIILSLISLAK